MPLNMTSLPRPLFIAHRGLCARYPENTLSAFTGAVADGAHMIELDVTLSRDRHLAVIHDRRVDRTTNGHGLVQAYTIAQLGRLDAGSWFNPRFSGESVPALAQVLDTVRGQVLINIEIKPEAYEPHGPADAVERQVLELVSERNMLNEVLISSFAWRVLARVRDLSKHVAIGLISALPADERLYYWLRRIDAFSWHPDHRVVTRPQVTALHALGAKVFPYAVNGRIETAKLLAMDVDGLFVDAPAQMTAETASSGPE